MHTLNTMLLLLLMLWSPLTLAEGEMESAVDEKRQETHVVDSLDLLLYVCLLILTVVTVWVFKQRRVRYLHESGLAIVYGLLVGLVLRLIGTNREISRIKVVENPINLTALSGSELPATPPDTVLLKYNVSTPDKE